MSIDVPALAPPFEDLREIEGGHALVGGSRYAVVEGALALAILRLVDGRRTCWEIAEALHGFPPATVHYGLTLLAEEGLVTDAGARRAAPSPSPVETCADGPDDRADGGGPRAAAAGLVGLAPVLGAGAGAPPVRVVPAPYTGWTARLLSRARDDGETLVLVGVSKHEVWVGPKVGGGVGCLDCLLARLKGNLPARAGEWDREIPLATPAWSPETADRARRFVDAVLGDADAAALHDRLWTLDLLDEAAAPVEHRVVARTTCPTCAPDRAGRPSPVEAPRGVGAPAPAGTPDGADAPGPCVRLVDAWTSPSSRSGSRIRPPAETVRALAHHVSPLTGAVRWVRKVAGLPDGGPFHAYTAGHASALASTSVHALKLGTRDQSGGKGTTDVEARASALCEALERYSAVADGSEPTVRGRLVDLPEAIDPRACQLFSEAQYAERRRWNAASPGHFQHVPEPIDPEAEVAWTTLWSLRDDRPRLLPAAYCYFGWSGPGRTACRADSNGLAAGNCLEEAVLQGLLELIERDAVAVWWYNRLRRPAWNLDGFGDAFLDEAREALERAGRSLHVLDVTADTRVPTCVAVSARRGDGAEIVLGFGAHLDPLVAARRAVLELGQTLPTVSLEREDRRRRLLPEHGHAVAWWEHETLATQPHLVGDGAHDPQQAMHEPVRNLRRDVEELVATLAGLGLDTLVHDLTRPELGLHVARVVVPGLRHFWRRLAPGRLFEVPVAMGWLDAPTSEADVNPVPLFL